MIGTQCGLNALAADIYPARTRGAGVGFALGVGRVGSIVGSAAGSVLLAQALTGPTLFLIAACPALVVAAAVISMVGGTTP